MRSTGLFNIRQLWRDQPPTHPASECAASRIGTGTEPPVAGASRPANHLERSFAFIDICGFTAHTARHGEHAAIEVLTRFRTEVRDVSARRGVRVGKWLGDGVMLVGTDVAVVAASAAEILFRFEGHDFMIHGGLASGPVLLYEGDDYIGRPVNLAARLCDTAAPCELLAVLDDEQLPSWLHSEGRLVVHLPGLGDVEGVHRLGVDPPVRSQFRDAPAA